MNIFIKSFLKLAISFFVFYSPLYAMQDEQEEVTQRQCARPLSLSESANPQAQTHSTSAFVLSSPPPQFTIH